MEDNEYTSIKDFLEMCEREGVRKVSELTQEESQAEEDEQIARYSQEKINEILQSGAYKLMQLFKENEQANKHNIAAQDVLLKALESAISDPVMESSPEVKRIAELFHRLINYRRASLSFTPESIFEQILEPHEGHIRKKVGGEWARQGGKGFKKKQGRAEALLMYGELVVWANNPETRPKWVNKHKKINQTTFCTAIIKAKLCDTMPSAVEWLDRFRIDQPDAELEKILPPRETDNQ